MNQRILIVDDDRAVRDSLRKVLEETGYSVLLAADGQEGVNSLERQHVDLLLLDLNLPKLTGFDLLDLAAARFPSLPVIILTGLADQCEPGALAGADVLLEKPTEVGLLLKTMEGLLTETHEDRFRRRATGFGKAPRAGLGAGRRFGVMPALIGGEPASTVSEHPYQF